jgi:hypothetical protein
MSMRNIAVIGVIAVLIIAYVAWTRNTQKPATGPMAAQQQSATEAPQGDAGGTPPGMPPASEPPQAQAAPPTIETGTNPGLAWTVPSGWADHNTSSMRLATYVIKGSGDTEATCAVYYFGAGQGGTVDANLARWQGEFKEAKGVARSKLTANGVPVEKVSASGTYMAHVGMMGQGSSQEMQNWALLGAIAEGPNGSVFFKLTGPAATVKAISGDFEKMLKSIHKA